jgi:hypothetical protein
MHLIDLPSELCVLIVDYLNNYDKCNFLSTCKMMRKLYTLIKINTTIKYHLIHNHVHIDAFTNIQLDEIIPDIKFPSCIKVLTLYCEFDFDKYDIPLTLQYLNACKRFNGPIPVNVIDLFINYYFNEYFNSEYSALYHKIRSLYIDVCTSTSYDYSHLPEGIEDLYLMDFNQSLVCIPSSVKKLVLFEAFNQPLIGLPNLIELRLGNAFNTSLSGVQWPFSLKRLEFGHAFNQPIECLPPNLTHLEFGMKFNQLISGILPNELQHLIFCIMSEFNQPLHMLPNSITHLTYGSSCDRFPLVYYSTYQSIVPI